MTSSCLVGLALSLSTVLAGPDFDDAPGRGYGQPPAGFAERVQAVTEAVLANHLDPPTRQQMIAAGLKGVYQASGTPAPQDLARRVSSLSAPEQFASFLSEPWPVPSKESRRVALEDAFFEGLFTTVPGGGELLSAKDAKVNEQFASNLYVGIQVALGMDDTTKRPVFHEVLEGGPADRTGAQAGDLIEAVDGDSTEGWSIKQTVDRLRGPEGTEVVVTIRRPKEKNPRPRPLKMTRGVLPRVTVSGRSTGKEAGSNLLLGQTGSIGYLKITEIVGSTPQELRRFAKKLDDAGAKGIILDLRQCHQSHFHPTLLLADALLDGGTIGQVRSAAEVKTYRAEPDALFRGLPLVVLVDGHLGGSVEWLAAALQDNHRAFLIGQTTAGKADVTGTVAILGGDWSVQMATGLLERGDGRSLARVQRMPAAGKIFRVPAPAKEPEAGGVVPDKIIAANPNAPSALIREGERRKLPPSPTEGNDSEITAAIEHLSQALKPTGS